MARSAQVEEQRAGKVGLGDIRPALLEGMGEGLVVNAQDEVVGQQMVE